VLGWSWTRAVDPVVGANPGRSFGERWSSPRNTRHAGDDGARLRPDRKSGHLPAWSGSRVVGGSKCPVTMRDWILCILCIVCTEVADRQFPRHARARGDME
jgi:hypothetical protein